MIRPPHEVEEVTSGSRLALVYTLYHSDASPRRVHSNELGRAAAAANARVRVPSAAPPQPATKDTVWPGRTCSKLHRVAFDSRNEGSECVVGIVLGKCSTH
jgi:hypothetical protein